MSTDTTTQDTTLTIFNGDIQFKNGDKVILASEIPTIEKVNETVKKVKEDFTKDQIVTDLYEYVDIPFELKIDKYTIDGVEYEDEEYYIKDFDRNSELTTNIKKMGIYIKYIVVGYIDGNEKELTAFFKFYFESDEIKGMRFIAEPKSDDDRSYVLEIQFGADEYSLINLDYGEIKQIISMQTLIPSSKINNENILSSKLVFDNYALKSEINELKATIQTLTERLAALESK